MKGVGDLIATAYVLTVEDPHRFRKSRDAGCFVGLQPGRRNSGDSEPQMHISKEGDEYLRTLLVQGAHYILRPFGEDSDLRPWGEETRDTRREKRQETGGGGGGTEAGGTAASVVGEWRGVRTAAQ